CIGAQSPCIPWSGLRGALACDRDFQGKPLVQPVHRPVAAVRYSRSRRRQVSRGFHVLEARGAQVIARTVDRVGSRLLPLKLQNRDGIQLLVPREVGRIDDLIVSDRRADDTARKATAQLLDAVQCSSDCAVPIRVHVRLEAGSSRFKQQWLQYGGREIYSG